MKREFSLQITKHGAARMKQRAVSDRLVNVVLTYADRETKRGGDLVGLSVSHSQIAELQSEKLLSSAAAEGLRKIVVLYSHRTANLVTVIKGMSRRANSYRRNSRQKYFKNRSLKAATFKHANYDAYEGNL